VITNPSSYASFKARLIAGETLTLAEKYRILEALYAEARHLGSFGTADILLGLDSDIRLAAALNANLSDPPG
jgi:hypothetical protein